ncbi:hypothetical protein [Nonomuraea guangzhouensis]|uniref:Uncharacterized protein n=1 Tax=Nonomuraea guangzhouensis TaxID=1291555 RepID=A0ABW4GDR1_9ACTN|nr:hypothetical protein [Nonomuraea guangzhouensis]
MAQQRVHPDAQVVEGPPKSAASCLAVAPDTAQETARLVLSAASALARELNA